MIYRTQSPTLHEVFKLLPKNPQVIEVGAADGLDTLEMCKLGAYVMSFECDPRCVRMWQERLADSACCVLFPMALSNKCGTMEFHQSSGEINQNPDWHYSGSLSKPTGHLNYEPRVKFENKIQVQVTTLDDWAKTAFVHSPHIDFLRIDAQGHDYQVLEGGKNLLKNVGLVQVECHKDTLYEGAASEIDFIKFFSDWEFYGRMGDDLLWVNNDR